MREYREECRVDIAMPTCTGITLIRKLGSGAFADVYLAQQDFPTRTVALKVFNGDLMRQESGFQAQLSSHPNVCTVFGAGKMHSGRDYIAMELCDGSLAGSFQAKNDNTQQNPRSTVLTLESWKQAAVQTGSALEFTHSTGIVHADVKPANILLKQLGKQTVYMLSDFGVSVDALKGTGIAKGWSPQFAAPETVYQGIIQPESDIYAFCKTFGQLLKAVEGLTVVDKVRITQVLHSGMHANFAHRKSIAEIVQRLVNI